MIILGVDPGTRCAGYAILKKDAQRVFLVESGVLKMPATMPLYQRIKLFFDFFSQKITDCSITHVALETPFMGKNPQNYLKLGYVRGILYLLAAQRNLEIAEFAPREIKQAVTGYGGAEKDQVARIIMRLFPLERKSVLLSDETDAIAISLCCLWRTKNFSRLL